MTSRFRLPLTMTFLMMIVVGLIAQVIALMSLTHKQTLEHQVEYRQQFIKSSFLQALSAVQYMLAQGRIDEVQRYLAVLLTQSDIRFVGLFDQHKQLISVTSSNYRNGNLRDLLRAIEPTDALLNTVNQTMRDHQLSVYFNQTTSNYVVVAPIQFSVFYPGDEPAKYLFLVANLSSGIREMDSLSHRAYTPSILVMVMTSLLLAAYFRRSIKQRLAKIVSDYQAFKSGADVLVPPREKVYDELSELSYQAKKLMSDLQNNQRSVSAQKDYFESLFMHISEGIVVVNIAGKLIYSNSAAHQFSTLINPSGVDFEQAFVLSNSPSLSGKVALSNLFSLAESVKKGKLFCLYQGDWLAVRITVSQFAPAGKTEQQYIVTMTNVDKEYRLTRALQDSESRLNGFLENVPAFVVIASEQGEVEFYNHKAPTYFPHRPNDNKPNYIREILPRELFQFYQQNLASVLGGELVMRQTVSHVYLQQTMLFEFSQFPIWNQQQRVSAVGCIIRECTEQKKQELEFTRTRDRLIQLIKRSPLAIIEWDCQGIIQTWNSAAESLLATRADIAVGRKLVNMVTAENRDLLRAHFERVIEAEHHVQQNVRIRRVDGRKLASDWHSFEVSKEAELYASIVSDVTDYQELVNSLMLKDAEKADMLNSMVDPVITIDESGTILSFNSSAERLFQYDEKDMLGQSINTLMPETIARQHDSYLVKYTTNVKTRQPINTRRVEGVKADGTRFPFHLNVSELPRQKNGKRRFIGNCIDLTHIEEKEQQLRRSMKMEALGKLTGGIAHDFNNLLGVIMGYVDISVMDPTISAEVKNYLGEIYRAGERASNLTTKLLSFSKKSNVAVEQVDLNQALKDCQRLLEKSLRPGMQLEYQLLNYPCYVELDVNDFENAMLNLVINAVHALEGEDEQVGHIIIRVYESQPTDQADNLYRNVCCEVQDNGPGIPEQHQDKVFDPFFSTKGDQGSGLGLSQVYGFVQRSGGDVHLVSNSEGTKFIFAFPLCHQAAQVISKATPAMNEAKVNNKSILLVDDEAPLADVTASLLRHKGFQVEVCYSPEDALRVLHAHAFDLLITDVVMPNVTGLALAEQALCIQPDIHIQLISGFSDIQPVGEDKIALMNQVLRKPFKAADLLAKVYLHLREH